MVSKNFEILEAGVIERSPFPDRTVYVTLKKNDKTIKILALHSLTGCGYYRSKSVQYDSFAEFIDEYRPDIIGIDANRGLRYRRAASISIRENCFCKRTHNDTSKIHRRVKRNGKNYFRKALCRRFVKKTVPFV